MNGKVSRNKLTQAKLGGARSPPLRCWSAPLVISFGQLYYIEVAHGLGM